MKRFLSLFLSVVMLLSITAGIDLSAYANTNGDWEYEVLDDGTASITGYNGTETVITIPSVLDKYNVTSIGDSAFAWCNSLTSITIPNSVISIGNYAFFGCDSLTSVDLGNGVESIGNVAFSDCDSLISVTIPNSVTNIGEYAFDNCQNLKSVDLGNGVESIGNGAFSYCDSLISVTIPNSVISIGNDAFYRCSSITSVDLGNGVESIGNYAFSHCDSLISVTIPNSVTNIGEYAFDNCQNLKSVDLGNGVESIGNYAFSRCDSLISVTIPNSVTNIGEYAFYDCQSRIAVDLGNGVESIGNYAFYYCDSLISVTIPNSVISIGNDAFCCCSITSVDLGNGVESIGNEAFYYCDNLISVTIPNSVISIGNEAFSDCTSLTSITIYNRKCEIYDSKYTISDTATIYGYNGSTAQEYAEEYGRKFVALDKCTTHKWDSGKVTKAATCTSTGVKTYTCTVCKATKTETIAKKAHSYKNYVTKATTSKNGSIVNKCSMCGAKKSSSTIYKIKSVSLSTTATYYNGKVKTPGVTVKDSKGKTLKKGTDYTVSYASGRKNVGRYAVKVTFKGNYSGSKTLYFNVIPKNVSGIKKLTAGKKRFTVSWNPQKTQVTGYQIQYSTASNFKNAKTITMGKSSYSAKKVTGRMAKKRYYVRIRTYKTVKFNGKNYNIYSPWCAKKSVVTKK